MGQQNEKQQQQKQQQKQTQQQQKQQHPKPKKVNTHPDANSGLIAVSYEARSYGVRRQDRGLEALHKCATLRLVQVPVRHCKADLSIYRNASKRVLEMLTNLIKDECFVIQNCFAETYAGDGDGNDDDDNNNENGDNNNGNDNDNKKNSNDGNINNNNKKKDNDSNKNCHYDNIPVEIASIDEVYYDITQPVKDVTEQQQQQNEKQQQQKQQQKQTQQHPKPKKVNTHPDANSGLIAVSYEARSYGVRRQDRGLEALHKCATLRLVQVPVRH